MKPVLFRLCALALFAILAPALSNAAITRLPYIQNVQKTSAVIMWESDQEGEPKVKFGPDEKVEKSVVAKPVKLEIAKPDQETPSAGGPKEAELPPPTAHVYEAHLEGLTPGQDVWYQVEDAGTWTPAKHFRTPTDSATKLRFAAYGDTRTQPQVHTAVGAQILKADPELIIQTGDFVSRGQDYRQWSQQFFHPMEEVLDHIVIWPSLGNHEGDAVNYHNLFNLPGDEIAYSFDWGPAHFAAIDSISSTPAKMAEWLEKDLAASKAKWKFVYYHIPTYNAGGHRSAWGRGVMTEVYRRNHVDAVFTGHSHLYERTFPIRSSYGADAWPVSYYVTGGGGAPLYELGDADYIAKKVRNYHVMIMEIDGDRMTGRVINDKGEEIDTFTIDKSPAGADERAKTAISEELTDFIDALHDDLDKSSSQTKAGEPFQADFKISAGRVQGPVTVTIKAEKAPSVTSVEPESQTITLTPGAETVVSLKVTAAVDTDTAITLSDADKEFIKRIEPSKKGGMMGKGLSIPLVQLTVHYETTIGKGDFVVSTLNTRAK